MSTEQSVFVAVPRTKSVADLVRDIVSAGRRAEKADSGDRTDVVRYEFLCVQLEALAERAMDNGAESLKLDALAIRAGYPFEDSEIKNDPDRLSARLPEAYQRRIDAWGNGVTVVELRRALQPGETFKPQDRVDAPDPADAWRAEGDAAGSRAVEQRFRSQIESVLAASVGEKQTRDDAINPSGVNNRIITQTLRVFVSGSPDKRVDAPVSYRDGSKASHAFPLRCLPLVDVPPSASHLTLRLALLSIRHTEMDPVVDGAWLRNAEVSRPRPAALTDNFVYETSRAQLNYLTENGNKSLLLYIYQTGLDTAIVGFYRAVVMHLLEHPFSLSVVPMFFTAPRQQSGPVREAPFRAGTLWTMGDRP